jgi:hypothetical protein
MGPYLSPDNTSVLRIVTVVQQFMTEFSGAVSEEEKIAAITKIVINRMKQNDHWNSQAEATKDRA